MPLKVKRYAANGDEKKINHCTIAALRLIPGY
jgi:hypothetical protein